jgi:hypothetical protein
MWLWKKLKPPLEAAEHIHFLDLVLEAAFGFRTWLVSVGGGLLMLFIAAADPKSWSTTEVLFYALGTTAFIAVITITITALIEWRRRDSVAVATPPASSGIPVDTQGQQPSNTGHNLTDQTKVAEKRALIREAREFVLRACKKDGAGTDFREKLSAYAPYYDLRPYLSEDFRTKWNSPRTIHVFAVDTNLPDIAMFFLDEIDRLEREWGV